MNIGDGIAVHWMMYWRKIFNKGNFNNFLKNNLSVVNNRSEWQRIKNFKIKRFGNELDKYTYFEDIKDFTITKPGYFFSLPSHRDCDDWAQMWYWWSKENNHKSWMIFSYQGNYGHMFNVIKHKGYYALVDYKMKARYGTLKGAIKGIKTHHSGFNTNDKLVFGVYRKNNKI